jgi:endonuclease/exonuclease/phosphatase family metal-dependent hydrolase
MGGSGINVTVASYNIHKGEGLDRRRDLARTADVLRELEADLIGIQEVYRPQAEMLGRTLGMDIAMGVTRVREGVPYGNAVLTRFSVHGSRQFDLTKPPREPRGGIRLDIPVGPLMLHLFNVPFGLKISERAHQVEALVRRHMFSDDVIGPRVVMGDLNEWFPGPVRRTLRREFHGPCFRRTHPAPLPIFALDRIYWDRHVHSDGFRVHRSRLARIASDHLPVVARLRLPAPPVSAHGAMAAGLRACGWQAVTPTL